MGKWIRTVRSDARECALNFLDQIVYALLEDGGADSDLLNGYSGGDSYHHKNHVDHEYRLTDAAELLDELGEWEETDSSLWHGLAPREAIGAQAAYTRGNATCHYFTRLIEKINGDDILADILTHKEDGDPDATEGVIRGRVEEIIKEF